MFGRALKLAGVLLVLFHGCLFGRQLWTGDLAEAGVIARWLVAGGLLAGLWALRRQGASLFFGRRAVAIWLLAALLHGPSLATRIGTPALPDLPDVVVLLTQAAGALTAGLMLLGGLLRAPRRRAPAVVANVRSDHAVLGALSPGAYLLFSPRPPPAA